MIAPNTQAGAEPLAMDYETAAKATMLSTATIRRAVASGELKAAKLGRAVRIRREWLTDWLDRKSGELIEEAASVSQREV